ncbi:MAG TPA: hypothetical protein VGJ05_20795 [Fimbriiglobus sp.]
MRRRISRLITTLTFVGMSGLISSCGPSGETPPQTGATLEGTVTYGNEPIQFALVIATGQAGAAATGKIDDEGRYHLDNVPLGEVKIAVNTKAGQGDYMTKIMGGATNKKKTNWKYTQVPDKFQDPGTTTLTTTINKGPNTYEIKIPK